MKKVFCVGDSTELLRGVDVFSTERRPISLTNLAFAGMGTYSWYYTQAMSRINKGTTAHTRLGVRA
jgi:hypothetical protein